MKAYPILVAIVGVGLLALAGLTAFDRLKMDDRSAWKMVTGQIRPFGSMSTRGNYLTVTWRDESGVHEAKSSVTQANLDFFVNGGSPPDEEALFIYAPIIGSRSVCTGRFFEDCRRIDGSWVLPICFGAMGLILLVWGVRAFRSA